MNIQGVLVEFRNRITGDVVGRKLILSHVYTLSEFDKEMKNIIKQLDPELTYELVSEFHESTVVTELCKDLCMN